MREAGLLNHNQNSLCDTFISTIWVQHFLCLGKHSIIVKCLHPSMFRASCAYNSLPQSWSGSLLNSYFSVPCRNNNYYWPQWSVHMVDHYRHAWSRCFLFRTNRAAGLPVIALRDHPKETHSFVWWSRCTIPVHSTDLVCLNHRAFVWLSRGCYFKRIRPQGFAFIMLGDNPLWPDFLVGR